MTNFNSKIRVFGNELSEDDTWVDASIEGYSIDGKVKLVEDTDTDPRVWKIESEKLENWQEDFYLIPHNQMPDPDHDIWDLMGQLEQMLSDKMLETVEYELKDMTRQLFKNTSKAQRKSYFGND